MILNIKVENIYDYTVDGDGTEEIDGSDTAVDLTPWDNLQIQCTDHGWIIL